MTSVHSQDTLVEVITPEPAEQHAKDCQIAAPVRVPVVRYDQYFDQRTFTTTFRKTSKPVTYKKLNKKKPIIIVRRLIDSRGQHEETKIDIKDPALVELIIHINREVKGLKFTKTHPVADMRLLFHSRFGLLERLKEEKAKESPDNYLVENIQHTLDFIQEDQGHEITDFDNLTSLGKITYELLWALFPPNTYVFRENRLIEQSQILLCRNMAYQKRQGAPYVELTCDIISHDGSLLGIAQDELEIKYFAGTSKIRDLPVYPLKYHSDKDTTQNQAIQRGKRFTTITRQLFQTTGPAYGEQVTMRGDSKLYKSNTFGRVMIDPVAFRLLQPNSVINLPVYSAIEDKDSMTDEMYLICTPVVLGFCFGTKMWGGFSLDRLTDIVWSEEAFNQLILGEKQKQLIHALVRQHSTPRLFDDIIVGKGKGLIGLLSGNPGCGKTLTAEACAEITHRPLYVVSAGELGTRPEDVDTRLARILELAHMWNAVLLLDEAEVFLHKRNTIDLARNALVSIFLRQLEYYQGILILTTNMIGECDPAFESRIHFCIRYPDLGATSRRLIWKTFLAKASEKSGDFSEEDIDRLTEHEMNGRQIKNAVSIAQSIALDQQSPLRVKHIDTVLEVLTNW